MEANQLRERTLGELQLELKKTGDALFGARFSKAANQLKDGSKIQKLKREIARISTIIREKGEK